ncbi:glycosyltransferase [Marimonas lutisalis]|uniref:glycosyltransferase n=1 Tax=Marimonas lutisalis TaxID=2545756 RepID=UPI001375C7CD|nr:glycosyltransferase [Marimonas lutisalis]
MSFEPVGEAPFGAETYLDLSDLADASSWALSEEADGEPYSLFLNELSDWALPGYQTVQLMIREPESHQEIAFEKAIACDASDEPLFFSAKLACHRARALLHVTFHNPYSDTEKTKTVAFDPSCKGGHYVGDYQIVSVPVPRSMEQCEVKLTIEYQGYTNDGSDGAPFLFLSDIKVSAAREKDRVSVAETLVQGDMGQHGIWVSAPLPVGAAPGDGRLSLASGNDKIALPLKMHPEISLVDAHNNILVVRSTEPQDVVLCVDDTMVLRHRIGDTDTTVRIPRAFLNGMTRHVSLKDATGSIILFEAMLPLPAISTPADLMQRESTAPFPSSLLPQTPHRYEALKQSLANADKSTDLVQLAYAMSVLEGGYKNVKLKPLAFPKVAKPDVSIVIPAHNKVEVTYLALCSLLVAHNNASFEVIVVDDASTDETAQLEDIVSGITVIHNADAQRFIRACNAGAEKAKGDYIVLLNNDVEVTAGWLDELIAAFSRFDKVGLVGAKLLYPNGQLQDAGGIIWGSGNPWNYGNGQNAMEPRFSYARQADYLSGAAMMVPANVWKEVGGLSSYLEPMYFEDTDFAFKVRDAGYTTWFVPSSVVYHYEGMTAGTDTASGYKKYQELNRPKFKRHWAKAYAGFGKQGEAPDLEKDRGIVGRVLFVDYATPRPDQDAGSYAALQEIKLVQSLGYKVSFMPMNMAHLGRYTEELQKIGVEMIYAPFYSNPAEYFERHGREFDAVYITRYYVAKDILGHLRNHAPQSKIIFNNADLHFLREIRAARAENDDARLERARRTREEELQVIEEVDVVLSYNEVEHSVIQAYTDGDAKVMKCPWVVDVEADIPGFDDRKGMSFLGSYLHHPNKEGIIWFVREIMPLVVSKAGKMQLSIYGSKMDDELRALKNDLVDPVGFVQEISDAYNSHRVFIAPLRSGAGIKGKVLSALAHGIPCVLSPTAAEGIGLRSGHDCFIAETPEDWAEAIAKLEKDKAVWEKISRNAQSYMAEAFSFKRGRMQMREAFEAADLFQSLD